MSTGFTNTTAGRPPRRIAVVGLGNDLLGDDGFGPLAVEFVPYTSAIRMLKFSISGHRD